MKSLKTIFISASIAIILLVFVAQTSLGFFQINNIVTNNIETSLKLQAEGASAELRSRINEVGKVSEAIANNIKAMSTYDPELMVEMIKPFVESETLAVGSGFWFEPYTYDANTKYFGPYVYKDNNELQVTWDYSNEQYDYFQYDWYKSGLNTDKKIVWSEPYLDSVTGVAMITSTSPIRKNGKLLGVTTCDIGLEELQNYVTGIKVGREGYAFIVTGEGYYLGHKDTKKNLNDKITEEKDEKLKELGNIIVKSTNTGIIETSLAGTEYYTVFTPVGDTGMKLVMFMPEAEVTGVLTNYFRTNSVVVVLAIMLIAIALYILITKRVTNPLNSLMQDAQKIASGDLTVFEKGVSVKSKDEIGQLSEAFALMVQQMNILVKEILEKSMLVATGAQQMNHNAQQTSVSAMETASTMEEISSIVENVNSSIQEISSTSDITAQRARTGSGEISKVTQQMEDIAVSTQEVAQVMNSLNEKALSINQIVDLITGIADQTNLLALNAAIEAARAGEQGRGFAVVAEEVRKLAEQTSNATKNISQIITGVQAESQKVAQSIGSNVDKVQEGSKLVQDVGNNFGEIIEAVQGLTMQIEQLATATTEMSSGVENVAAVTEEQTATMEEVSSTSESLTKLADELNELVQKFKVK